MHHLRNVVLDISFRMSDPKIIYFVFRKSYLDCTITSLIMVSSTAIAKLSALKTVMSTSVDFAFIP